MDSNVQIIHDIDGRSIVVVNDIRFKGRQHIAWEEVEEYLKQYVGHCYEILETADKVYIGSNFPKEFKGSIDTKTRKGTNAKAKANATQKLPVLLKNATNKRWNEKRHASDDKLYLYDLVNIKKEKETKYPT